MDDDIGEVGWSREGHGQLDLAVAGDGGNDDDEKRDGGDGEVSLSRMEVEFDDGDLGGGVGDKGVRGREFAATFAASLNCPLWNSCWYCLMYKSSAPGRFARLANLNESSVLLSVPGMYGMISLSSTLTLGTCPFLFTPMIPFDAS